ncbi:MAG: hypothetical protein JWM11_5242 [Planctomycetaceae bacterium]|nr:hypothetical protein [Planctomycetaceae bacterium]
MNLDQRPLGNPDEHDSFEEMFQAVHRLPNVPTDLSETIFLQTCGVLSRRRWYRRGLMVAGCAACYAIGILSGWILKPDGVRQLAGEQKPLQIRQMIGSVDEATSKMSSNVVVAAGQNASPVATIEATKVNRERSGNSKSLSVRPVSSQFESFRRAGDRQLFERGNIRGAMECYRRALAHATVSELHVEYDRDSWLLMSLKQSRLEERKHVRQKRA